MKESFIYDTLIWYRIEVKERSVKRKKEVAKTGWKIKHLLRFVIEPILFLVFLFEMSYSILTDAIVLLAVLVFKPFLLMARLVSKPIVFMAKRIGNLPLSLRSVKKKL